MQRKYLSGYRTNEGKALAKKKLLPICSLARGAIPVSSRSRGRRPAHGAIPGLLAGGTSPADLARRGTSGPVMRKEGEIGYSEEIVE